MTPSAPFVSWEALGRNAAPLLEGVHAVVVAGPDPVAAASFALGIARVLGSSRRVAIADLVGEVAPLQALVVGDDAHGISDSFLYGVSLNKIARSLEGSGNVFLMPSGTEPVANETVYRNERWRKLAAGFQQVGALLLVVAVPGTPGFADLCEFIGALFPIGDPGPVAPPSVRIVALPRPAPPSVARSAANARRVGSEDSGTRNTRLIAIASLTIAIALIVGMMWPAILERLPDNIARMLPGYAESNTTRANGAGSAVADTSSARALAVPTPASDTLVANPGDSAVAAAYAVYLVSGTVRAAAAPEPRVQALPAVAVSAVLSEGDSTPLFRVTVGASEDEAGAQALLGRLRAAGILGEASGTIVRVPFAFRLEEGVSVETVPAAVAAYAKRGIAAYALQQKDGRVSLYTGAHETAREAAFLADSLRRQAVRAVLVYRTGRAL